MRYDRFLLCCHDLRRFGVEALSIGVGGLPGILSIKPQYYLIFLLAMAVAIVIPFTLTFIVGRIKLSQEDRFGKEAAAPAAASAEETGPCIWHSFLRS